jgi:hypothetical protein
MYLLLCNQIKLFLFNDKVIFESILKKGVDNNIILRSLVYFDIYNGS